MEISRVVRGESSGAAQTIGRIQCADFSYRRLIFRSLSESGIHERGAGVVRPQNRYIFHRATGLGTSNDPKISSNSELRRRIASAFGSHFVWRNVLPWRNGGRASIERGSVEGSIFVRRSRREIGASELHRRRNERARPATVRISTDLLTRKNALRGATSLGTR